MCVRLVGISSRCSQLARSHHGADIRYTGRVARLAERLLVPIHRSLFTRKIVVHKQTIRTCENAILVWLAILKTPEVRQNLGQARGLSLRYVYYSLRYAVGYARARFWRGFEK